MPPKPSATTPKPSATTQEPAQEPTQEPAQEEPFKTNRILAGLSAKAKSDDAGAAGDGAASSQPSGPPTFPLELPKDPRVGKMQLKVTVASPNTGEAIEVEVPLGAKPGSTIEVDDTTVPVGEYAPRSGKALWKKTKVVTTVQRARISAEEAERMKRSQLVPFSRPYVVFRWVLCWLINLTVFAFLWIINYSYGVLFGPKAFVSIMYAWFAALIQTFGMVEPAEVLLIVLLPGLMEWGPIAKLRANLKEYGFI